MSSITRHPRFHEQVASTQVPARSRPTSAGQAFATALVLGLLVAALLVQLLGLR